MRLALRLVTMLLIVTLVSLTLLAGMVAARWRMGVGQNIAVLSNCRNGMVYSALDDAYGFRDWDYAPDGEPWSEDERTAIVTPADPNQEQISIEDNIVASKGTFHEDLISGVESLAYFTTLRWDIELDPGDEVEVKFDWDDDGVLPISVRETVTDCTIADELPPPTLYETCNVPTALPGEASNWIINFPADIEILDLDVFIQWSQLSDVEPISATLSSPGGTTVQLFEDLTNAELGETDSSCDFLTGEGPYGLILDDEGYLPVADYDGWPDFYIPTQPLEIFDGTSTLGQWDLTFTDTPSGTMYCTCLEVTGYRTVRFIGDTYEASEGEGTVTVPVELSEPSTMTTTVSYATTPEPDSNQEPQSGTLTFLPGEEMLSFEVDITDDELHEPDESVGLTLTEVDNQYGLGTPVEAMLLIVDDDVAAIQTVHFNSDSYEASEGDGAVPVTVELSEPSTMTTTVSYATIPEPASNQEPQSGALTFLPGEQMLSFEVEITDDELDEPDETVGLTLTEADNGYELGTPSEATLLLVDDDELLHVYIPTIMAIPAPPATIANGDFEAGRTTWLEYSSNGYPLIYHQSNFPVVPHGGSWAAWLGGDDFELSQLSQVVSVPMQTPVLGYWHWIESDDLCGYDFARIFVDSSLESEIDMCHTTSAWVQRTLDLSDYAGSEVTLLFEVETDYALSSAQLLDDIAWQENMTALSPRTNTPGNAGELLQKP